MTLNGIAESALNVMDKVANRTKPQNIKLTTEETHAALTKLVKSNMRSTGSLLVGRPSTPVTIPSNISLVSSANNPTITMSLKSPISTTQPLPVPSGPIPPLKPRSSLAALGGDASDLLTNLLGVEDSDIDKMLEAPADNAAEMLGV